jgi:hypothetical protein
VLAADAPAAAEYVPTSHGTHALAVSARSRGPNVPGGQSEHALAPRPANAPAGHAAHAPGGSPAPLAFLNAPPPHGTHGPPSGPMWPARHRQASRAALAAGELEYAGHAAHAAAAAPAYVSGAHAAQALAPAAANVPAAHAAHAALPEAFLNVPAAHGAHTAPAEPVCPASHSQSNTTALLAGEREFAGQAVHALAPAAANVPAAHAAHTLAPAPAKAPAAHATQSLAAVRPVAAWYVPAPHGAHAFAPEAFLNVPTAHAAHGPPSGPLQPAWHTQLVCGPLPLAELVPAGQGAQAPAVVAAVPAWNVPAAHGTHAAAPVLFLNVPAAHAAHGPPSGPLQPAWHTQLVRAALPAAEVIIIIAPAAHALHAAEPEAFLNVPAAQSTHVCPSAPVAPGLHRQAACSAEPCDEFELAGQGWQNALPGPAQVPGAHALQDSLPVAMLISEYEPPGHPEHA